MDFFKELYENFKTIITTKYADFNGRAGKREFWMFVLANVIVSFVLGILPVIGVFLAPLYSLAVFVPNLAVAVRRLHDIGKAGINLLWGYLLSFVIVGAVLLIMWFVKDSEQGDNAYGPQPQ